MVGFGGAHGFVDYRSNGGEVVEVAEGHGVVAEHGLSGEVIWGDGGFAGFDGGELRWGVFLGESRFFGGRVGGEVGGGESGRLGNEAERGSFNARVFGGMFGPSVRRGVDVTVQC